MAGLGRQVQGQTGLPIEVSFDGRPEWKGGGISVDWNTVAAVTGTPLTLADGTVVPVGDKAIPFGTVMVKITASGKYGPADTTQSDGRQTVDATRIGEVFVLNRTELQNPIFGIGSRPSDYPPVIAGGYVWKARLQVGGTNQPTLANLLAAMPRLLPVEGQ